MITVLGPRRRTLQTKDQLPRIFQANLARLFEQVIQPAMEALPVHASLECGEAATMDEFLDRAAAQVDNYTANEAAKAFTLTLAGIFERQLSIWARAVYLDLAIEMPKARGFQEFLAICAERAGIDVQQTGVGSDLNEMFMVANVVRHGEGSSCEKLMAIAPMLWDDASNDYHDLLAGPRIPSEHLRIRMRDLVRYIWATTRFWGLADPLPMAVTDPPYRVEARGGESA
ncbi:hypothetical protein FKW15_06090 [Acetobacter sp. DmW_125133]|uniref:Uncharacterized protein n=2 Tax=Acetobacter TaxID=434 RepID=A0ABC8CEA2_9PROT|nr:hypothetical protein CBI36_12585 [Acetobacter oryzifermentans]KAA8394146.1 hypothetical protein FKW20_13880 [Acetobacter sp. DmW_125127]KAA8396758.1 hypothetical protein FKW22_05610 [Acetobacter sp. DmW_125124]KAA8399843.1 hypothetical protein FKW19_02865 [Acetobacter sp. DmW_125128]KAA8406217.1 hypothetical protein FKW15_06090 [Acetobacter sp. DmW_125133]KAA8407528.1 hypothetical protein FKW24_07085 [Acetobacter sp. DmW_125134]KAA8408411.1 hypothetical protein FKW32_00060 [Acetobacter sp.